MFLAQLHFDYELSHQVKFEFRISDIVLVLKNFQILENFRFFSLGMLNC